jgi:hypothetical protein
VRKPIASNTTRAFTLSLALLLSLLGFWAGGTVAVGQPIPGVLESSPSPAPLPRSPTPRHNGTNYRWQHTTLAASETAPRSIRTSFERPTSGMPLSTITRLLSGELGSRPWLARLLRAVREDGELPHGSLRRTPCL